MCMKQTWRGKCASAGGLWRLSRRGHSAGACGGKQLGLNVEEEQKGTEWSGSISGGGRGSG